MLSILIPVYNYNITSLIYEIHKQVISCNIDFEILVFDDGSNLYIEENNTINKLSNTEYKQLPHNIGRSAIRNSLAAHARHKIMLFLDADVEPSSELFLKKYIDAIDTDTKIISGGLLYKNKKPKNEALLRWKYGHSKESITTENRRKKPYLSFLSSNFLIHKSVFNTTVFNEKIPNLACEDTLFALDVKSKNIPIKHIDNPVFHLGLETSSVFLKKSLESIEIRKLLVEKRILNPEDTKITALASKIKKLKLQCFVVTMHNLTKRIFLKNLISSNPSLLIFDLYRLGHYFSLKK